MVPLPRPCQELDTIRPEPQLAFDRPPESLDEVEVSPAVADGRPSVGKPRLDDLDVLRYVIEPFDPERWQTIEPIACVATFDTAIGAHGLDHRTADSTVFRTTTAAHLDLPLFA